jgi:hypothetical protein
MIKQAEKEMRNYLKRIYPELHKQLLEITFQWHPDVELREKERVSTI